MEPVTFKLPHNWKYLQESSKVNSFPDTILLTLLRPTFTDTIQKTQTEFLETVELSSNEKRMKGLFDRAPDLIFEMDFVYKFASRSRVFKYIHMHYYNIKLLIYGLVIMLNLNILMAHFPRERGHGCVNLRKGVSGSVC